MQNSFIVQQLLILWTPIIVHKRANQHKLFVSTIAGLASMNDYSINRRRFRKMPINWEPLLPTIKIVINGLKVVVEILFCKNCIL